MHHKRIQPDEEDPEINLSSMIDCIFILLIFFIVTTVFVEERGIQVSKPDAAEASAVEDGESLTFDVTAENKVLMDDIELSFADVTVRVKSGMTDSDTPIVIRAHAKSDHGTFVGVWDAARRGGAETLSFSTTN